MGKNITETTLRATRKVGWNLKLLMVKNNIRSAVALHKELRAIGLEISSIQLSRIVYDRPVRISMELLEALLTVFDCDIEDLMPVQYIVPEEEEPGATEDTAPPSEAKMTETAAVTAPEPAKPTAQKPTASNVRPLKHKAAPRKGGSKDDRESPPSEVVMGTSGKLWDITGGVFKTLPKKDIDGEDD